MSLLDGGISPLDTAVGHINALIYGPSGNGKTTCATTTPGKVAFLSSEPQGASAVEEEFREQLEHQDRDPDSIKIFEVRSIHVDGKLIPGRKYLDMLLDELEHKPQDFTAVVLDSITDVQNSLVTRMKMDKGGLDKNLTQQEWGYIIDSTRNLCVRLRNLKLHTVVIALATETQDDQNRIVYRPNLVGKKLPQDIPQYFNIVTFLDKEWEKGAKVEKFIARMRSSSSRIYTKGRRALDSEEVPNIGIWMDKISSYRSERGQDPLPTKSGITKTETEAPPGDPKLQKRLDDPKTKAFFEQIGKYEAVTDEKRIRTLKKYRSDEKLWEVLEGKAAALKKAAEKKAGSK